MLKRSRAALAVFAAVVMLTSSGTARAQMPDFNSLSEACQGLYNAYVGAYQAYADYYFFLKGLYPNGDNPPDTAAILGQKIDAM